MSEKANMAARYEHEIPEGYEARIEGNKVIFELKESEDERIRKEIIGYLTHRAEVTGFINEDKDCKRWISYLEKQKEQRFAGWSIEDENALVLFHELISFGYTERFCDAQTAEDMRKWLNKRIKSIRLLPR